MQSGDNAAAGYALLKRSYVFDMQIEGLGIHNACM
jgi:hypothetical protein